MDLAHDGNLLRLGDAADVDRIDPEIVDQLVLDQVLERPLRHHRLAGRERHVDLGAKKLVGLEVVRGSGSSMKKRSYGWTPRAKWTFSIGENRWWTSTSRSTSSPTVSRSRSTVRIVARTDRRNPTVERRRGWARFEARYTHAPPPRLPDRTARRRLGRRCGYTPERARGSARRAGRRSAR